MVRRGRRSLYNLVAELCAFILGSQPDNYLIQYSCISAQEKERIENKIGRYIPEIISEEGTPTLINDANIQSFVGRLGAFATELVAGKDGNCVMRLLQAVDSSLAFILENEMQAIKTETELHPLNTNGDGTGVELFPRCGCLWARKSRQYFSERRIDIFLKYLLVVERERTAGIHARHIFLPKGFFPHFDKYGVLKVAASPVSARPNFDVHYNRNQVFQSFGLDYREDEEKEINNLIWHKIITAGAKGSELAVFPEMMGTRSMENVIRSRVAAMPRQAQDKLPALTVLPTVFFERQNCASVLDRRGRVIARQYKQNPYVMVQEDGSYMEDIAGSEEVVIFHYPGIGRFCIMICKDFLTTRYMEEIMRNFKLTLILIPAFSTGAYDFRTSFETCAHDYCNVVWINSCAAMIPGKEKNFRYIGYIRKRITRYQMGSDAYYEMRPCPGLLTGECQRDCMYYDGFGRV